MNSVELYNNIYSEDYKDDPIYHNYEISLREYLKRQNKLEFTYILNNELPSSKILNIIIRVIKSNDECWIYIDYNINKYISIHEIIKHIVKKYNIKNISFFGPVESIDYNKIIFPYIHLDDLNIEYTGLNKLVKVENIPHFDYNCKLLQNIKQCLYLYKA